MRRSGLEVREAEERVRGRLDPDELDALGRNAALVELLVTQAPSAEQPEEQARSVVGARCEGDRVAGPEQREDERRRGRRARGKEQRVAAFELAEQPFRLESRGVGVALVEELADLAVRVGERRGAVERGRSTRRSRVHEPRAGLHDRNSTGGACPAREARIPHVSDTSPADKGRITGRTSVYGGAATPRHSPRGSRRDRET